MVTLKRSGRKEKVKKSKKKKLNLGTCDVMLSSSGGKSRGRKREMKTPVGRETLETLP